MERPTDGTEDHAGNAAHGKAFDGDGTGAESMDAKQDRPAGIRHKGITKKGGAKMLEPLIEPKPSEMETILERNLPDAIEACDKAIKALEDAENALNWASEKLTGTPEEDRLTSLRYDVESVECGIRSQKERMKDLL